MIVAIEVVGLLEEGTVSQLKLAMDLPCVKIVIMFSFCTFNIA